MRRALDPRLSAAVAILGAVVLGVAGRATAQTNPPPYQIPLLPEDTPADARQLGLGPWNGPWILRSARLGDVEVTTYFCPYAIAGQCRGTGYVRPETGSCPAVCEGECTGPCEGSKYLSETVPLQGCVTDADCPMDNQHWLCDDAKAKASDAADATCKEKGGANCVCFAHARVTEKSSKCKTGPSGAKYCKFRCLAVAKGSCSADWVFTLGFEQE